MPDDGPNAALNLEDNLKEIESGDGGGDWIDDLIDGASDVNHEPEAPEPEKPARKSEITNAPEPEKEESEGDAEPEEDEGDDDWDPLSESSTEEETPEPEEEEEEPEPEKPPKTSQDWEKFKKAKADLRRQYKEVAKEKATLEQELAKLREEAADLAELREQKEQFEEAQKELAISRVEGTVEYKRTIETPLKAIEEQVVAIAKSTETPADKLFDAILEADPVARRKLLKEATEDMDTVDQSDVFQMARDAQEILVKRAEIRANAHEAAKEAREHAEAQEAAAAKKAKEEYMANASHAISELRKRTPFKALKDGETEDTVYAALEKRAKETDFSKLTADKQALAVAALLHSPRLLSQLQKAQKEIETLEGRLSRKNAARPKVGGSYKDAPEEDTTEMDEFFGTNKSQDMTSRLKALGVG